MNEASCLLLRIHCMWLPIGPEQVARCFLYKTQDSTVMRACRMQHDVALPEHCGRRPGRGSGDHIIDLTQGATGSAVCMYKWSTTRRPHGKVLDAKQTPLLRGPPARQHPNSSHAQQMITRCALMLRRLRHRLIVLPRAEEVPGTRSVKHVELFMLQTPLN